MSEAAGEAAVAALLVDEAATRAAGRRLGAVSAAGLVILARGDLGAGKTTFAQGLARGLGVPPGHYVNSPSFAILLSYPGRLPFFHLDLYRLGDPDEALGLGLEEVLGGEGVAFVEWPDRLPTLFAEDHLALRLLPAPVGEGRRLELQARGSLAREALRAFVREQGVDPILFV